jgi:hypothetical protein
MTTLWDFAGVDGLAVARELFGEQAARLSVWQSVDGEDFSVLRLCENNFRARLADGTALRAARGRRIWWRACDVSVLLALDEPDALTSAVSVKPPHRLQGLPRGRAIPARLDNHAVLLWRHGRAGQPVLEVQTAPRDADAVRAGLRRENLLVSPPSANDGSLMPVSPRAEAADSSIFVRATGARGETP